MASAMCSTGASCRRMSFSCGVEGGGGSHHPGSLLYLIASRRIHMLHILG